MIECCSVLERGGMRETGDGEIIARIRKRWKKCCVSYSNTLKRRSLSDSAIHCHRLNNIVMNHEHSLRCMRRSLIRQLFQRSTRWSAYPPLHSRENIHSYKQHRRPYPIQGMIPICNKVRTLQQIIRLSM